MEFGLKLQPLLEVVLIMQGLNRPETRVNARIRCPQSRVFFCGKFTGKCCASTLDFAKSL